MATSSTAARNTRGWSGTTPKRGLLSGYCSNVGSLGGLFRTTHRPIHLEPDLRVWDAPDLATLVHSDDPQQIEFLPIVDYGNREA